jgi:type IV pilus assembly protein PilE
VLKEIAMTHHNFSSTPTRPRSCGFTLIELLIALSVAGILSAVAYPSFLDQVAKVRRADALVAMVAAQMAEERWRANQTSYGSLAEIGMAEVSSAGHYSLQVTANTETGYQILATARGSQQRDTACRNMRLGVDGANLVYASGPDTAVANPAAINRRCWSL